MVVEKGGGKGKIQVAYLKAMIDRLDFQRATMRQALSMNVTIKAISINRFSRRPY